MGCKYHDAQEYKQFLYLRNCGIPGYHFTKEEVAELKRQLDYSEIITEGYVRDLSYYNELQEEKKKK